MKTTTRILLLVLATCVPGAVHAYRSTLPQGSLLCLSERQMEEAVRAVDRRDVEWLAALSSCRVTRLTMDAQRLDCGMRTCKIRFWGPGGSAIGYTFRNYFKG
jgi:hypothetical protein